MIRREVANVEKIPCANQRYEIFFVQMQLQGLSQGCSKYTSLIILRA